MSILWCGGEDVDFPNGTTLTVTTAAASIRSGYSRSALGLASSGSARSSAFSGGGITSGWLSVRGTPNSSSSASGRQIGFGLSGTTKGIFLGGDTATAGKFALHKYDGTTSTQLVSGGSSTYATGVQYKFDLQLISFGASGTLNLYLNGSLLLTYTGDLTLSGVSSFDCVAINGFASFFWNFSEVVVADEDTRSLSLVTMAPTGLGTTDQWTGAATDINENTNSDATVVVTNTVGQDEQFNITDFPTGSFSVKALKIAARSIIPAGSTPTTLKLGVNSGGTVNVDAGTAVGTGGQTVERFMATNPITSAAWQQSEMNALQMNLRSA